ncbi:hypothetical protein F5Y12DRAFT_720099 [Xylaria sp. FL1777]|nr:hypothetical protein F5Y12DRAFT_720099 [Xylaria sp. FL1777]
MDSDINYPYGYGSMEAISIAITVKAMEEFIEATNKYIGDARSVFATEVWKDVVSKNEIAKHKISLLGTVGEKHTKEASANYEREQASCWGQADAIASRIRIKAKEKNTEKYTEGKGIDKKNGSDNVKAGSELDTPKDGAGRVVEPQAIHNAQKAVAKYIHVCKEETRERDTSSWSLLSSGLETIDADYKKARTIVKQAIEAAANNETDESKKVGKEKAEGLLKKLRKVWYDARGYFFEAMDEDLVDSEMDEEEELGLY